MLKLTTLNNKLYFHAINEKELKDIYISYTKMYNLIINENNAVTIKNAIQKDNDKKYKARDEVIGKITKENKKYVIKIGVGKNFKSIESIEDIAESYTIELENYEDVKNFVTQDFEKYELYEDLKKKINQNKSLKNKKKDIEGF